MTDIKELVEDLELELLKSDEVTWEQEQKIAKTMEQMDEIYSQIEKIINLTLKNYLQIPI